MSNPREEWLALAKAVWPDCPYDCRDGIGVEPCEANLACRMHEAIATGLAQSFYNGVRVGLEGEPEKGPITKRLVIE